ncbi:MAG: EAL domain-containing protein [Sulfurospirillaceae bacterium]|nr:EAL domain-containing protein [Sulfurospirillaceae bacterium]
MWVTTNDIQYFREQYIKNPQPVKNIEFSLLHKNGTIMYFDCNFSPRFDKHGQYAGSDNFAQDITKLKKTQKQIEHMATYDALTALPNRVMLMSMLEHSISGSQRAHDQMAVLFLDLDNFKDINDNFGHQEGDRVLIKMAEYLKKSLRLDDMIFRFGGDEFVVIVEHIKHNEDVINVVEKIKKIFTVPFRTEAHSYYLSCSIGIAIYPEDAVNAERLIRSADAAMYKAKKSGRDRYAFYSKELGIKIQKELYIENLLREALKKGEFELYYQPQISLSENQIVGIEALIRWNNKELGFVHPESFIAIAEKTQLISAIDIWVLRTACSQVKKWHDMGIYKGKLSVNISGVDLSNENLATLLQGILNECCLEAKYLDLEITETVLMSDPKHSIKLFDKIKEMGVDISIDDFGTGYSSLSYLRMFPIDELKIDKSFVDDLPHSKDASAIVNTIISLAKTLGYKTVAEGVETVEQIEHLKILGCDIVQGYYHSKALSVDDIEVYFQKFL